MHTEVVEVFTGISYAIGLWSATAFPKFNNFSNKLVFSHLLQRCREPSDFEI